MHSVQQYNKEGVGGIIRLTKNEVRSASEVLARALYDDPQTAYVYPNISERNKRLKHVFELILRFGVLYGEVYATSENLEGIAVWVRSEKAEITLPKMIRCGDVLLLWKMGWNIYKGYKPLTDYIEMKHKHYAPFRHWYLDPIGVEPQCQGKGHGGKLICYIISRADEERLPIYLYTTKESNVRLYEHYGFKVVGYGELPGTGVPYWSMVRISTE